MRTPRAIPFVLALTLAPACAWAFDTSELGVGGTLSLEDRMPLISKTPRLKHEVTRALAKAGKKPADVTCDAARFSGTWKFLGGERVSPYTCDFGEKWLQIRADVRLTGARGRVYATGTTDAMRNADKITETNLRWTWTTEDPHKAQ